MSLTIAGISAHFHDAACCLLRDGELVAAAEEERFSRVKHDPRIPKDAFRFCLERAGISIAELDCVAYFEDPVKKLHRQLWMGLPELPSTAPEALFRLDATRPEREIREILGYEGRIERFDHHQSHAASAYYYSGFEDAALLTVDAVGEWTTTSYGHGRGADLEIFEEVSFPHSLGLLYSTITGYLGFEVNDAEYKVMGLAPYGEPRYLEEVRRLISLGEGGQYRLNLEFFDFSAPDRMHTAKLEDLFGHPPQTAGDEPGRFSRDLARSLQVVLEETLLHLVRALHERVPSENLCLAGGVALNCVANGRIIREGPFRRVFIQPAAGDNGGSLGAAALAHVRLTGERPRTGPMRHVSLGPAFSSEEVLALLAPSGVAVEDYRGCEDALLRAVAGRLAAGQVAGWFQGRMEFGPRALGNRSILADPRRPEMQDRVNALIKQRERFRPFAPAVLAPAAGDHFALDHPSPFMLEVWQVCSALPLPAITHVDGSARVQTVDPEVSPRFARLLETFAAATGCPVLLNTSFNLRGEPIVCTPVEALLTFIRSGMDFLVLEEIVIDRAALPESWLRWFSGARGEPPPATRQGVYSFL